MRYCPACLAESGGAWPRRWTDPLELVCQEHRIVLRQVCPACAQVPFYGHRWFTTGVPGTHCEVHLPAGHQHRTRYRVCGFDLRITPAEPMADADDRLQAQQRLHELARRPQPGSPRPEGHATVCGVTVTRADHLDAVLELIVEQLGATRALATAATDPGPVLGAASVALAVLAKPDATSAAALAERHGLLDPAGSVTPIGPESALTRRRRNPLLASIRLGSLHGRLSPTTQLVFRTASDRPRYPCPTSTTPKGLGAGPGSTCRACTPAGALPLATIPQQLWPGVLTPWVDEGDHLARAAAAMMLAKLGSTRPWRLIAIELGLPASFATHPPALVRHLRRENTWGPFARALDRLADRLDATPAPIDYQTRRWRAGDPQLLTATLDHAHALSCDAYPACLDPQRTDYTCGYSRAPDTMTRAFWQLYTAGDARLARSPLGDDGNEHDTGNGSGSGDPVIQHLFITAACLLHAHHTMTSLDLTPGPGAITLDLVEPLTWRPP